MNDAAKNGGVNRVCVLLDANGDFAGVASDSPIAVFVVDEAAPSDRVYAYASTVVGRDDSALLGAPSARPPARPTLRLIVNDDFDS